jgi:hypothetical protein
MAVVATPATVGISARMSSVKVAVLGFLAIKAHRLCW